jgi:hypothetical protein
MRRITQWSLLLDAIAATALASTGSGSAAAAKTVNGWSRFHDRTDHVEQARHETEGRRLVPLRHQ